MAFSRCKNFQPVTTIKTDNVFVGYSLDIGNGRGQETRGDCGEEDYDDDKDYESDTSEDLTTSLTHLGENKADSDDDEDEQPSLQEVASKILWVRRLFPELQGELVMVDDACETGNQGLQLFTFSLSKGFLRREKFRVRNSPKEKGDDASDSSGSDENGKVQVRRVTSLSESASYAAIMTHFLYWESRMVDTPLASTLTKDSVEGEKFRCCKWTLAPRPLTDSDGNLVPYSNPEHIRQREALKEDWISAIAATQKMLLSPLWRETEVELAALAGALSCNFEGYLPVVPVGVVLRHMQSKFDLSPLYAKELLLAFVDLGLLLPTPEDGGFRFSKSIMRIQRAYPRSDPSGGKADDSDDEEDSVTTPQTPWFHEALDKQEAMLKPTSVIYKEIYQLLNCSSNFDNSLGQENTDNVVANGDATEVNGEVTEGQQGENGVRETKTGSDTSDETIAEPRVPISHPYPCDYADFDTLLPCDKWPQGPLMLQPTPNSGTRVLGVRFSSCEKYISLSDKGFCKECALPINNGKEAKGKSLVIDFQTDLFRGMMIVRIKHAVDAVEQHTGHRGRDYFSDKKRTLQVVVRGHFCRDNIPIPKCVTGQIFSHRWKGVRPRWVLRSAVNLMSALAPHQLEGFIDDQPRMLAPLAAVADNILVHKRDKKEDEITELGMRSMSANADQLPEALSILEDVKDINKPRLFDPSGHRRLRKSTFEKLYLDNSKQPKFRVDREYTFEFYNQLIDFEDFSIDMGPCGRQQLGNILNGQPLKIMAAHAPNSDANDVGYLWSFDLWHESLYPMAMKNQS